MTDTLNYLTTDNPSELEKVRAEIASLREALVLAETAMESHGNDLIRIHTLAHIRAALGES